jgi:teichuronic acid biosynthesis glycosyltransferase TuaC
MNILVVTNMYPSDAEPWFGSFVKNEVAALRNLGLQIDVLQFDGRGDRAAYLRAISTVRAEARRRRPQLIHAHYGLTGAVAMFQRSAPVVTTFHGSDVFDIWQRRISWVVARRTVPIFVSRAAAEILGLGRATVIPSAVDTERFVPADRTGARRELGWEEEGQIALFGGSRANPVKRVELFDAALALARERLPGLRSTSLEGLSRDAVAQVMNAADVTVLTSDWEGSPVVIKESLACNTPVVSVAVGDVADVLRGLPGCAVTPPRADELAEAIVRCVTEPPSTELRRRALEYSTSKLVAETVRVYEQVLS